MDTSKFKPDSRRGIREKSVEKMLVKELARIGGMALKWVSPGCSGVPDRIVIYNGRIELVELKRPGQKLRPLQEAMQSELIRCGAYCATVSTPQEVKAYVEGLKTRAAL